MTRDKFLATKEEELTTVRIVTADDAKEPFNRLLNTIIAGDDSSFVALEEDAKGAAEGMTVKLPEKRRRVIQKINVANGIATVHFVIDRTAPKAFVPAGEVIRSEPEALG